MDTAQPGQRLQLLELSGMFKATTLRDGGRWWTRDRPLGRELARGCRASVRRRLVRVAHTESGPEDGQGQALPGRGRVHTTPPAWGSRDRLQATHKRFLNSLSWPTVISISA